MNPYRPFTEDELADYQDQKNEERYNREQARKRAENANRHPHDPNYISMEDCPLDSYRCTACGKRHETCRCGEEHPETMEVDEE